MLLRTAAFAACCSLISTAYSQQVTGVWKGKINKSNVEVKIIQNGDSLTGTSYYYESANSYRRYSIKGYFDQNDNSVVWWDDQLIEDNGSSLTSPGKTAMFSVADFNCPGGDEMYLEGKATPKQHSDDTKGRVDLTKITAPRFPDEWDFVVDNYTIGANDPDIIDSVFMIAFMPTHRPAERPIFHEIEPQPEPLLPEKKPGITMVPAPDMKSIHPAVLPLTIEEKYTSRQKIVATEIPIEGDSVELRFYDNAEVDGDSISLFLNDKMIFTHIRLSDKAYSIHLAANDLQDNNELTMVAENLGSIPPNTSYMVALAGDKRYEAKLASTENSSAMIRLIKSAITKSPPSGK